MDKHVKKKYYYNIILSTFIITLVTLVILFQIDKTEGIKTIFFISLATFFGWFLIFVLPLLRLFFNHKRHSKFVFFEINDNIVKYINNNRTITFTFDDIEKIELWLTPPAYDERTDWLFFGKYHFTRIYTKQNQVINVSCLVFDKTKEVFPEELIKKKKKFLPLMVRE